MTTSVLQRQGKGPRVRSRRTW